MVRDDRARSGIFTSVFKRSSISCTAEIAPTLSLASREGAENSLEVLENAINNLVERRAELGAITNRLSSSEAVFLNSIENLSEARSRILDADIAFEIAELSKQQILQQAASSVLMQANLQLRTVLTLLDSIDRS